MSIVVLFLAFEQCVIHLVNSANTQTYSPSIEQAAPQI